MTHSFLLTSALVCTNPKMLGPLVLGCLIPFAASSELFSSFINGVYEKGRFVFLTQIINNSCTLQFKEHPEPQHSNLKNVYRGGGGRGGDNIFLFLC